MVLKESQKNILPLCCKPLISHTINHALNSKYISRIIVSTDDTEIGFIAKSQGAEVICRPQSLASDTSTSESALLHALDILKKNGNADPDLVVFLQATSPIRKDQDIDNAIAKTIKFGADSLFSATLYNKFIWRKNNTKYSSYNYDYRSRPRIQDRLPEYAENGSIYIFR